MNVSISKQWQSFIDAQVKSGEFGNANVGENSHRNSLPINAQRRSSTLGVHCHNAQRISPDRFIMKIGPCEIASAIGAGGMGEVFRARDTRLNRNTHE